MKLLFPFIAIFLFLQTSALATLSEHDQDYLIKKQKVTMCIDPNWMPYEKIENGQHIGMSAEYFQYFEEKLGIPIELVITKTWTETLLKGKTRECDILSLAAPTPERLKHWNFTDYYLSTPLVLATPINSPFVNEITDVLHQPIGSGKGYAYTELLRMRHPNINLIDTETLKEGLQKVIDGEYYGYLDTLATIGYLFQTDYTGQLKISGKFTDKFDLAIAVRKDDEALLAIFNKLVNGISKSKHQEIANRWIAISVERKTDYSLVWQLLGIILLLIVIGIIWYYIQKKYVGKLKNANSQIQIQNEQLRALSTTDSLTNIHNRSKLNSLLTECTNSHKRYERPFSLILIDIDHFKQVNDVHGHLAGDQILIETCQQITSALRDVDLFGRWGGEEFLVICKETSEADALIVATKIQNTIREHLFSYVEHLTISSGVVAMQDGWSKTTLIEHADEALYRAKSNGRNQAISYNGLSI